MRRLLDSQTARKLVYRMYGVLFGSTYAVASTTSIRTRARTLRLPRVRAITRLAWLLNAGDVQ